MEPEFIQRFITSMKKKNFSYKMCSAIEYIIENFDCNNIYVLITSLSYIVRLRDTDISDIRMIFMSLCLASKIHNDDICNMVPTAKHLRFSRKDVILLEMTILNLLDYKLYMSDLDCNLYFHHLRGLFPDNSPVQSIYV